HRPVPARRGAGPRINGDATIPAIPELSGIAVVVRGTDHAWCLLGERTTAACRSRMRASVYSRGGGLPGIGVTLGSRGRGRDGRRRGRRATGVRRVGGLGRQLRDGRV